MPTQRTPRQPSVARACPVCDVTFMAEPNRIRAGKDRFCSVPCARSAIRKPRDLTCEHCGAPFRRTPGQLAQATPHYCSRACQREDRYGSVGLAARFWAKVRKASSEDGCWIWDGALNRTGYGVLLAGSRMDGTRGMALTHRVSWDLHYGPIPAGLWVLHRCDNPPCVRPDHLFLGTPHDNSHDMYRKGRARRGGRPILHLTEHEVRAVRHLLAFGAAMTDLAELFPLVSQHQMRRAIRSAKQPHVE